MSIKPKRGFTLIELLIVIAIIAILVGFTVVVAGGMMNRAKSTKDMANHRIIGASSWSHAIDHKGSLLHPRVLPYEIGSDPADHSTEEDRKRLWVASHGQDTDGNDRVESINGSNVELQSALLDGAAFPYIGDLLVYQSPIDPTIGDITSFTSGNPNVSTDRIRSYSLNGFVGVRMGADDNPENRDSPPLLLETNGYWIPTETVSQINQPSSTMCSIGEEDKNGRNENGWILNPTSEQWPDFPAFWGVDHVNISYIDGSTGTIALTSNSLKEKWEQYGHHQFTSGLKEYKDFRKILLPGRIGTVLD